MGYWKLSPARERGLWSGRCYDSHAFALPSAFEDNSPFDSKFSRIRSQQLWTEDQDWVMLEASWCSDARRASGKNTAGQPNSLPQQKPLHVAASAYSVPHLTS
jgi:hypothetical protein